MHVNLPLDKTSRPAAKPHTPAPANKPPAENFGDLLKSAQASAGASPTPPANAAA